MKATERTLSQILHSPDQYVIPVFQRFYSWTEKEWRALWEDLLEVLDPNSDTKRHFLGSVVVVADNHLPGVTPSYQVIDGQQRLITLSLLLCAIRDAAKGDDIANEIKENYLVHKFKKGLERYKIYPRFRDRDEYAAVADGEQMPAGARIADAYYWFGSSISLVINCEGGPTLRALFTAVTTQLDFVVIALDRDENPYKIFSSLNSKGLDLAQADLIRNFVFMNLPLSQQDQFDDAYWRPLEAHFESAGVLSGAALTAFFRDYLMSEGEYVGKSDIYSAFQKRIRPELSSPEGLAQRLLRHADAYEILLGHKVHPFEHVESALAMVRDLYPSTTYPLLLALLEHRWKGFIDDNKLALAFRMVASFIFRRYVTNESSQTYHRWFAVAASELGSEPVTSLRSFLEDKGWPDDAKFESRFVVTELYNGAYARQVLVAIERAIPHKEPALLSQTQIEHVMPQVLTDTWRSMLGEWHQEVYGKWLNTPGNLTLTGYNQTLGNRGFKDKKREFAKSNILMNRYFRDIKAWTGEAIEERGKWMAKLALRIWKK
jgi:hypothetical protein